MDDPIRHVADTTVAAAAVVSPWWLHFLDEAMARATLILGVVYLVIKVWEGVRGLLRPTR